MTRRLPLLMLLATACGDPSGPSPPAGAPPATPAAEVAKPPAPERPVPALDVAFLKDMTRRLSTDEMEGRRPGTEGARRAVALIIETMKAAGLQPAGEDGGWTQRVPMRAVKTDGPGTKLSLTGGKGDPLPLTFGPDVAGGSFGEAGDRTLDAPLVFLGYGITAPEYAWDDYAGVDMTGKVAVVFVGDPPLEDGRFGGKAMTYYGRWTYKFERALEAGATGCLVIHETEPASYDWNVVESSWSSERFAVVEPGGELPKALEFQGWISRATAEALAAREETTLPAWHARAVHTGFRPTPLATRVSGSFRTTERRIEDVNVLGSIDGAREPGESVLITAHWDHLGIKDKGDEKEADLVFNGAVDNASGIAGMLAVAGDLAARPERPGRSVVFLATTAEEQGLLGSKYYAAHPLVPLDKILGVINLDSMNVDGRTRNLQVVGMGQSELEDLLGTVARGQQRTLVPDERPEAGAYYRSDHFSFANRGVPAIYFRGGKDMEEGGVARGEELSKKKAEHYHTVSDQYDESWSFEGALQDARAVAELVLALGRAETPPAWKPTSEFARLRPAR